MIIKDKWYIKKEKIISKTSGEIKDTSIKDYKEAKRLLKKGKKFYLEGKYGKAYEAIKKSIEYSNIIEAKLYLVSINIINKLRLFESQEMLSEIIAAEAIDNNILSFAYNRYGVINILLGKYSHANVAFLKAEELNVDLVYPKLNRIYYLRETNKFDLALSLANSIVEKGWVYYSDLEKLLVYIAQGDFNKFEDQLKLIDPFLLNSPFYSFYISKKLFENEKYKESFSYLKNIFYQDLDMIFNIELNSDLIMSLHFKQNFLDFLNSFEKVFDKTSKELSFLKHWKTFYMLIFNKVPPFQIASQKSKIMEVNNNISRYFSSALYFKEKKFKIALIEINKIKNIKNENLKFLINNLRAKILFEIGSYEKVVEILKENEKQNNSSLVVTYSILLKAYKAMRNMEESQYYKTKIKDINQGFIIR